MTNSEQSLHFIFPGNDISRSQIGQPDENNIEPLQQKPNNLCICLVMPHAYPKGTELAAQRCSVTFIIFIREGGGGGRELTTHPHYHNQKIRGETGLFTRKCGKDTENCKTESKFRQFNGAQLKQTHLNTHNIRYIYIFIIKVV